MPLELTIGCRRLAGVAVSCGHRCPLRRTRITASDDQNGTSDEGPSLDLTATFDFDRPRRETTAGASLDHAGRRRASRSTSPARSTEGRPASDGLREIDLDLPQYIEGERPECLLSPPPDSSCVSRSREVGGPTAGQRTTSRNPSNAGESIPAKSCRSTRRTSFFCSLPLWKRGRAVTSVHMTTNVTPNVHRWTRDASARTSIGREPRRTRRGPRARTARRRRSASCAPRGRRAGRGRRCSERDERRGERME